MYNVISSWKRFWIYGLGILLMLLLALKGSMSIFHLNAGWLSLSYALANTRDRSEQMRLLDESEAYLRQAISRGTLSPEAHRGLGFIHWARGEDEHALAEWRAADMTVQDIMRLSSSATDLESKIRWYVLASQLDESDFTLMVRVGKNCQQQPDSSPLCERFLQYTEGNWLLDPDFLAKWETWNVNRREGVIYNFVPCPDLSERMCATIKIGEVVPQQGASIHQCLHLYPNTTYYYSAWLKIVTEGTWIPLYHQGNIDGKPAGRAPGNQTGSQDWRLWERTFTAEEFDSHRACFHPVRLMSQGQVWFYGAQLKRVDE